MDSGSLVGASFEERNTKILKLMLSSVFFSKVFKINKYKEEEKLHLGNIASFVGAGFKESNTNIEANAVQCHFLKVLTI